MDYKGPKPDSTAELDSFADILTEQTTYMTVSAGMRLEPDMHRVEGRKIDAARMARESDSWDEYVGRLAHKYRPNCGLGITALLDNFFIKRDWEAVESDIERALHEYSELEERSEELS